MSKGFEDTELARRAFLAKCGKYALVTPPVVTLMLSASGKNNYALALSGSSSSGGGGGGSTSFSTGFGVASTGGDGAGAGPWNPGILQSGVGGLTDNEVAELCNSPNANPSRWRQYACVEPAPKIVVTGLD